MTELIIDVHDLQKSFGTHKVVHGLNLQVAAGEVCRRQWQRQDDNHPHALRSVDAGWRQRNLPRIRHRLARIPHSASGWLYDPALQPLRESHGV